MKYYIWTVGCQMNKAESCDIANHLELLGLENVKNACDADIAILNTCVVRQNAEDKVRGMLGYMKGIKYKKPEMRIAVTGCFVNDDVKSLTKLFPHVNYFFKPGEGRSFEDWLFHEAVVNVDNSIKMSRQTTTSVSAYIPIVQGCNNFCSYCIVPSRRGRERSRPPEEIVARTLKLVERGVKEIVLLGQNVNAYGKDLNNGTNLSSLLASLNRVEGLLRIRFLTNHPKDMNPALIKSIASLDKVCHHICLPMQAGDDSILKAMNRHYTYLDYRSLVSQIRNLIPDIALSTDIIVGFPGESENQFRNTYRAIEETRFDAVHVASYSPRPDTYASKNFTDDVPYETKMQRLRMVEDLQGGILEDINQEIVGTIVKVLVESKKGDKWYGRTYSDKLTFFRDEQDYTGRLMDIEVRSSSPWALQGLVVM